MRTDGQSSWAKIIRIVHGKGQRADMCTDGQSSWAKITHGQSSWAKITHVVAKITHVVAKITHVVAKITREAKNSKINIFEESFLKGNIKNMSTMSLGCQVLIKSCYRHP